MADVRRANAGDIDSLIAMGQAMHDESPRYRDKGFSASKLRTLAAHLQGTVLAENENALIAVATKGLEAIGMFVGVVAERWFCEERYASELVVYVKPAHRGSSAFVRLVHLAEDWARRQGLPEIVVGVSTDVHPQQTVRAYEKLGYTLSGYSLVKRL